MLAASRANANQAGVRFKTARKMFFHHVAFASKISPDFPPLDPEVRLRAGKAQIGRGPRYFQAAFASAIRNNDFEPSSYAADFFKFFDAVTFLVAHDELRATNFRIICIRIGSGKEL